MTVIIYTTRYYCYTMVAGFGGVRLGRKTRGGKPVAPIDRAALLRHYYIILLSENQRGKPVGLLSCQDIVIKHTRLCLYLLFFSSSFFFFFAAGHPFFSLRINYII